MAILKGHQTTSSQGLLSLWISPVWDNAEVDSTSGQKPYNLSDNLFGWCLFFFKVWEQIGFPNWPSSQILGCELFVCIPTYNIKMGVELQLCEKFFAVMVSEFRKAESLNTIFNK